MSSDSIINASIPISSKDFPKKKRANRSAKLKQCKLDARREQWLSQVKSPKEEVPSGNNRELNGPASEIRNGKGKGKGKELNRKGVDVMSVNVNVNLGQIHNPDGDWEESLLSNSPTSCVNETGNNYAGFSGSSTSRSSSASSVSFGSGGSCSGSISEEEGGDDGCLDDWEAVADALVGAETNHKQSHNVDRSPSEEARCVPTKRATDQKVSAVNLDGRGVNNKAWRPDDAFRPQSLPNLSKQGSFPAISNPWVRKLPPLVPTSCPICCEDLDLTDSNFLPCPCGFHLCLFCHKRIIEEDSRCPGCRKPYSSEEVYKETGVSGGTVTIQLARSYSMFSRV